MTQTGHRAGSMTTCNATHPQADVLAVAGVVIAPCRLYEHSEGRHEFLTTTPVERPATIHVVLNLTPEQWESDAAVCNRGHAKPVAAFRHLRMIADTVAATQDRLGVPVGVIVRTYTEGPDAA